MAVAERLQRYFVLPSSDLGKSAPLAIQGADQNTKCAPSGTPAARGWPPCDSVARHTSVSFPSAGTDTVRPGQHDDARAHVKLTGCPRRRRWLRADRVARSTFFSAAGDAWRQSGDRYRRSWLVGSAACPPIPRQSSEPTARDSLQKPRPIHDAAHPATGLGGEEIRQHKIEAHRREPAAGRDTGGGRQGEHQSAGERRGVAAARRSGRAVATATAGVRSGRSERWSETIARRRYAEGAAAHFLQGCRQQQADRYGTSVATLQI